MEVVVIVGALLTTGSVAYASLTDSQITNRDAQRREDVVALQQAYESYYEKNKLYAADCKEMSLGYLNDSYPLDPLPEERVYEEQCSRESYCVCANLEKQGSGNSISSGCEFNSSSSNDWFCVDSLN